MNYSKSFTCQSGKLRTEFTSPIAKSTCLGLLDATFLGVFLTKEVPRGTLTAASNRKATVNLPFIALESFFDSPKLSVSFNVQIVRTAKYIVRPLCKLPLSLHAESLKYILYFLVARCLYFRCIEVKWSASKSFLSSAFWPHLYRI